MIPVTYKIGHKIDIKMGLRINVSLMMYRFEEERTLSLKTGRIEPTPNTHIYFYTYFNIKAHQFRIKNNTRQSLK